MAGQLDPSHIFDLAALSLLVPPWSLVPPEPEPDSAAPEPNHHDPAYLSKVDEWVSALRDGHQREQVYYDESLPFYLCLQLPPLTLTRSQATSLLLPHLLPSPHLSLSAELAFVDTSTRPRLSLETTRRSSLGLNNLSTKRPSNDNGMSVLQESQAMEDVPGTPLPVPSARQSDAVFDAASAVNVANWNFGDAATKGKGKGAETSAGNGRVWVGRKGGEDGKEGWVGVFEFTGNVAFLRSNLVEPKLCLTVTVTFRDDPKLLSFLSPTNGKSLSGDVSTPEDEDDDYMVESFDGDLTVHPSLKSCTLLTTFFVADVNLLQSLDNASDYYLPASRLPLQQASSSVASSSTRRTSLSGRRRSLSTPGSSDEPLYPTIRRATRRVLSVHSPLNVRMRTVPCLALGVATSDADETGERDGMVMCVELRGTGDPSGAPGLGFEIDSVDVQVVRGAGAGEIEIKIIPGEESSFPIRLFPTDQHNLLYSINYAQDHRFDVDAGSIQAASSSIPCQSIPSRENHRQSIPGDSLNTRNVTIVVKGRPVRWRKRGMMGRSLTGDSSAELLANEVEYSSAPFDSRWTCILDVSPFASGSKSQLATYNPANRQSTSTATSIAFPLPFSSTEILLHSSKRRSKPAQPLEAIAGSKRHTVSGLASLAEKLANRSSLPVMRPHSLGATAGINSLRALPAPPADSSVPQTPGTTGLARRFFSMPSTATPEPPSAPPLPVVQRDRSSVTSAGDQRHSLPPPPSTPAFPPYSSARSSFPTLESLSMGGISSSLKHESWNSPQINASVNRPFPTQVDDAHDSQHASMRGEVLVSVGLIPLRGLPLVTPPASTVVMEKWRSPKVRALDTFLVEIFVLNRGERVKRFTVGTPRRGGGAEGEGQGDTRDRVARIVALESDVRIGPLAPQSCQSVRLRFLAVCPGSHTLPELSLMDVETGVETRLRNPVSVVVV